MSIEYFSVNRYPGDGVTTAWDISFAGGYIDREHVKAFILDADGVQTDIPITDSMFVTPFRIDLGVAAPVGGEAVLYRDTPKDIPLVDFQRRSRLTEANLDKVAQQSVFGVAEIFDAATAAGVVVAEVVAAGTAAGLARDAAQAARDQAQASAVAAAASASSASTSASNAASAASAATAQAGIAATQASNASGSASAASGSASAAAASATSAQSSANSAAASAAEAAASAAVINPAAFVQVTGNQTIGGTKTFSNILVAPGLTLTNSSGHSNGVYNGNGDAATSTQANLQIRSWLGIGFSPSISGQPVPQNENAVWIDTRTGNLSARGNITAGGQFLGNGSVPPGAVMHFAMNSAPTGWLSANGAAVSRTTFAALFAAIGTTYGAGDGSTTFRLPDLRGEFIRGIDNGRGVDVARSFGTFQGDEIRSHQHALGGGFNNLQTSANPNTNDVGRTELGAGVYSTFQTGGAETRPRNVAMLACIKF